ncbi:mitochondrial protein Fmp29 [Histoplasma ohiense]|nr:mitochondrial protein Fmp29 [Histoplasma ohiense (nom. inval.)]
MIYQPTTTQSLFQALARPAASVLAPILHPDSGTRKDSTYRLSADHEDRDSLAVLTAGATKEIAYLKDLDELFSHFSVFAERCTITRSNPTSNILRIWRNPCKLRLTLYRVIVLLFIVRSYDMRIFNPTTYLFPMS